MKAREKYFAFVMMILSVILASKAARAQSEMEMTCRSKAKIEALEIYQGCMSEARTQKINTIRESYRAEIGALKAKYDEMLKELKPTDGGKAASPEVSATKMPPMSSGSLGKAEIPTKGVPSTLPAKKFDNGPALPVQTETGMVGVTETEI